MRKNTRQFLFKILIVWCLFQTLPTENINSFSAIYDADGNGKF